MARRMRRRLALLAAVVALPLALWALLPLGSSGAPGQGLQNKIDKKKGQIQWHRGRERVLSSDIAGFSRKISSLQSDITVLQTKQIRLQTSLDLKRAQLARIQERLRQERLRLARLRARLAEARDALAVRLVELYKADQPDIVTVVLESNGFADLLERTEFMHRVSAQDSRIIARVKAARIEAIATAKRLDRLEEQAERVARAIAAERDQVAAIKGDLVTRRDQFRSTREQKSAVLASTRDTRQHLEGDLAALEKEQARVQAALQAAAGGGGGGGQAGPVRQGSGSLIWPVNGPVVSGFGMRWGRLHAGVDIAVPAGTPIRAADSGKVVLLGWTGGYGNYTCVQHNGSLSTCYAHQSRYGTSNGASVSKGQVIGYVGCTGHCFGDHLHFETRVNGSPVDPMGYL
jgi:murein DD-endopeptidase MepM/ murein hydrolase activator NlpD